MEVNLVTIGASALLAMALGAVWYGPLFGSHWMKITGISATDKKEREKMQKEAGPLYAIQFLLVLFQVYVLAHYVKGWSEVSGIENALWIWAAFVMPTIAAASMWTNDSRKVAWHRFLIQAGYHLVLFIAFGYILDVWG